MDESGDPTASAIGCGRDLFDSREAVDATLADGIAAGGSETRPVTDLDFMYQRQLTDPDGNVLEFGHMDPVAAEYGPEAFMIEQA